MQVEQKQSERNQKNGDPCARETPDTRSASGVFVNEQRLGGRGAAAHGVDPHGVVHHDVLLVGAPVGQVGINLRENKSTVITPILTVTKGHCGSFRTPNNLRRTLTQRV